jgi:hypothetical protein
VLYDVVWVGLGMLVPFAVFYHLLVVLHYSFSCLGYSCMMETALVRYDLGNVRITRVISNLGSSNRHDEVQSHRFFAPPLTEARLLALL